MYIKTIGAKIVIPQNRLKNIFQRSSSPCQEIVLEEFAKNAIP
jgi:hypothetical protein